MCINNQSITESATTKYNVTYWVYFNLGTCGILECKAEEPMFVLEIKNRKTINF